jgi:hypothetical protein
VVAHDGLSKSRKPRRLKAGIDEATFGEPKWHVKSPVREAVVINGAILVYLTRVKEDQASGRHVIGAAGVPQTLNTANHEGDELLVDLDSGSHPCILISSAILVKNIHSEKENRSLRGSVRQHHRPVPGTFACLAAVSDTIVGVPISGRPNSQGNAMLADDPANYPHSSELNERKVRRRCDGKENALHNVALIRWGRPGEPNQ